MTTEIDNDIKLKKIFELELLPSLPSLTVDILKKADDSETKIDEPREQT